MGDMLGALKGAMVNFVVKTVKSWCGIQSANANLFQIGNEKR